MTEWHQKYNIYQGKYRENVRHEMIEAYGGKCVVCRENDPIVLVLDHIDDDAWEDKRVGGYNLYLQLRRQGWPKGRYQLLCHNCNFRKEYIKRRHRTIDRNTVLGGDYAQ